MADCILISLPGQVAPVLWALVSTYPGRSCRRLLQNREEGRLDQNCSHPPHNLTVSNLSISKPQMLIYTVIAKAKLASRTYCFFNSNSA